MKNGLKRFEFYLVQLEALLLQSEKERNPGLVLYSKDARTPLFMLEGLAKLYAGMHDKKIFEKLKEDFKMLEDGLGAIDYYDCFAREFENDKKIPAEITAYMHAMAREKIQHLNDILQERNWIGENADRLLKIRKKLFKADWLKDEKEVEAISDFYKLQIKEINSFAKENLPFTEVETQLHAVRRKLRWLSIYPRALQGLIQLAETVSPGPDQTKYLVPAVVNSPFNKMPERGVNKYFLMLDKNSFLALSWMIDNLGKLKDEGLRIIAISEALQQTKGLDHFTALSETMLLLGNQPDSATVLSQGSSTCETFFKEQHLEKLVAGIKHEEQ